VIVLEGREHAVDVVLVVSQYHRRTATTTRAERYFEASYELAENLWLARIEAGLCDAIANACTPTGENHHPTRNYGFPYAFVRTEAPIAPNPMHFDSDARIGVAIQLSRLVHPTSASFQYAARLQLWDNHRKIVPANVVSMNRHAFVLDEASDWLVPDDVPALRDIIGAYYRSKPCRRILAALFHHEYAARCHFIDARMPHLITALEALIRIKDERDGRSGRYAGSTQVFVRRIGLLAAKLGMVGVTDSVLREVYGLRSEMVHGLGISHLTATVRERIVLAEGILRDVLKRGVLDPAFAAMFIDETTVAAALPL
jgi:hypothetical protein